MQRSVLISLLLFLFLPLALAGLPGQAAGKGLFPAQAGQDPLLLTAGSDQDFGLTALLLGEVGYFAGQTNLAGSKIPLDKKRFLGGEQVCLQLQFSSWPERFILDLGGKLYQYRGVKGRTGYELILPLSDLPESLDWQGQRQAPAWNLAISAWSGTSPQQELACQFSGLELTGDVRDLIQVQPVRP